jgi:uncharacterized protein (DUF302 family)
MKSYQLYSLLSLLLFSCSARQSAVERVKSEVAWGNGTHTVTRVVEVTHLSIEIRSHFEDFTRRLEAALGRIDRAVIAEAARDPQAARKKLSGMGGMEDLILFDIDDHGSLLVLNGAPRKAKQYVLGNPLIAIQMSGLDIRAALYAPLRMLVFEDKNKTVEVEYDLPSSLFGQFGNSSVTKVGRSLDLKMQNLIRKVDSSF